MNDVREATLVYINQGTEGGVRMGMELEIYRPQPPLVDPETGRNLGSPDRFVATGTVEEVADVRGGEGPGRQHHPAGLRGAHEGSESQSLNSIRT